MNFIDDYFIQKSNFILNNSLKIDVLKHAEVFSKQKDFKLADGLLSAASLVDSLLIPRNKNTKKNTKTDREIWAKFQAEGWTNTSGKQGIILPESVMISAYEIFHMVNSQLAIKGAFTREVIKLLERHLSSKAGKLFLPALKSGEAFGIPILNDNTSLTATPKDNHFEISGNLQKVFYLKPAEKLNIIQLIPARIDQDTIGVFVVPYYDSENKTNGIDIEKVFTENDNWCVGNLNYSTNNKKTTGYLLTTIASANELFDLFLNELNHQLSIFGVATIANLIVTENINNKPSDKENDIAIRHSDFKSTLYSIYEGLKGAVLSSSFQFDCKNYAGEAQAEHFIDSHNLTSLILKIYTSNVLFDLIKQGVNQFGLAMYSDNSDMFQQINEIMLIHSLGNENANLSQIAIEKLVQGEGELINSIISDFQKVDTHQAKSPQLRSAIGVWLEYIGGIILLQDDMNNDKDLTSWKLFAERYIILLGNVMVAYHLIQQALESEKQLEEMGVNFFNISLEIEKNESVELLFQNVLLTEHFVHNILTLQERQIRILQKKTGILF